MTVTIWSDVGCPWATVAVWRWQQACERAGVPFELDHRSFPLELVNGRCTPKPIIDAEVPVVGALEPDFGFRLWSASESEWPVTTLPAMEAVHAAKAQGLDVSTALDLAVRKAFFAEGRCISMRHVLLDVATSVDGLGVDALTDALDSGRCRRSLFDDWAVARTGDVKGSPHLFLADGTSIANPGVALHWEGEHGNGGFPVVDDDDPAIYDGLLSRAGGA